MAAPWEHFDPSEARKYQESFKRLLLFHFREDEQSRNTLNLLLDEVVSIDPLNCVLQGNMKESALLGKLSREVPFHHDRLVGKTCILICFLCGKKNVSLVDADLDSIVYFLTEGLKRCQSFVHIHLLNALSAVCNGNTHRIQKHHDTLVGAKGVLLQLTDDTTCEDEVVVEAVKCIAVISYIKLPNVDCLDVCHLSACFDTLVHLLHRTPHLNMATSLQHKLLMHCFSGIQNIMTIKRLPNVELGILFAAVRAYMFYGLTSHAVNIPSQLYPTMVTPLVSVGPAKVIENFGGRGAKVKGGNTAIKGAGPDTDKGKARKARKKKGKGSGGGAVNEEKFEEELNCQASWSGATANNEVESWEQTWLRVSSSDSEYSETESSVVQPQRSDSVRVRQSALNCFLNVIRVVDKKTMFGFWSSFIPDAGASSPHLQSLFTTILKDPSPKCRMAGVACLTCMLESTRPLLAAAEEISTVKPAFSSFSSILGSMVREIHRCLLQALVAENYKAVLTQIVKCLGSLVNNSPYHRLNPGLLTRVLKHIRHFFNHKDPNVRTACLTCIGSMMGIRPPLLEVSELVKPPRPPVGISRTPNPGDSPLLRPEDAAYLLYPVFTAPKVPDVPEEATAENQFVQPNTETESPALGGNEKPTTASEELSLSNLDLNGAQENKQNVIITDTAGKQKKPELNDAAQGDLSEETLEKGIDIVQDWNRNENGASNNSVESVTPVLGAQSGADTPVFTDRLLQAHARETSWVIKLCLKSVHGQAESQKDPSMKLEPLPIRLEALQVMSNLIKNYFPVIRQSFRLLQELIQECFEDTNPIIVLHGTKVLDELTQALQKDVQDALIAPAHVIPKQQILDFWLYLLEGPLPKLLSQYPSERREGSNFVCSGACECMANIGDEIFSQLPRPRQMQCVTLVLGLVHDEDRLIKASAVRALGVYVAYSVLKDDVAFVIDATKAILTAMVPNSNSVRLRASWAMANLCDTLVDNKLHKPDTFVEDFPDSVLLELLQRAGTTTKETDKISCNAARAVGNLLRYLPAHCFSDEQMLTALDVAVKGLTKNMNSRTMKVRWNSCYAASNVFKNDHFPLDQTWRKDIMTTLCKVVQSCTNFKVRINASLGLSSPSSREGYCSSDVFAMIWSALVTSLETSENISDFAEYRYRDSLIEHICGAILHLTNLIEVNDLGTLSQPVNLQGHTLRNYMEKYIKLLLSQKTQKNIPSVEEVKDHLVPMMKQAGSDVDRRCLHSLIQSLEPDLDTVEEIGNFKQVYD